MHLHHLNPSMKALTIIISIILLALIFDPITPIIFSLIIISLTFVFGRISWKKYILYYSPFFILAFAMLWTTIAFSNIPGNPNEVIHLLGMSFPRETLLVALALAVRVISVASLSLLFIFTTDVVSFVISLIQQFRLPPKIAYGVLAGYRFLPMMKDELFLIRNAHQIRGVNQNNGLKERFSQYKGYVIPLLASAIRKAERTAIAMESKGFTGSKDRSYYRHYFIKKQDWLFLIFIMFGLALSTFISIKLGYFKWYGDIL